MKKLLLVVSFGLSASAFGFFATSPAGAAPAPSSHLTSDHDAGHLMSGHDAGHLMSGHDAGHLMSGHDAGH